MNAFMEPVAYPMEAKQFNFNNDFNSTGGNGTSQEIPDDVRRLVTRLLVKNSQQNRQAIIIITAFGIAASLLVIYGIFRDAHKRKKIGFHRTLHTAEVFPCITALAIVIQGSIFIGVQANALSTFWATGCALTAQLIWPAVWLVPVVILVFSLEVTLRSLRKSRFQPRGKWATPICLAIVVLLMIALWLTAFLMPALNMCPASLIWWTVHYSRLGVVFGPGIILTHFITAAILISQLWRTVKINRDERIAASRVVYSLAINVLIIAFVLPFWVERLMGQFQQQSSRLADIAVTLGGIFHSALYCFLRANADRLAIRPRETPWSKKKQIRLFGPNDLNMGMVISTPLLANPEQKKDWEGWQKDGEGGASQLPIHNPTNPRPANSPKSTPGMAATMPPPYALPPVVSEPPKSPKPPVRRTTKTRYSIFPTAASANPIASWISSRSNSSEDVLSAPVPLFSRKHGRNDSTITSATVEIGMRLSSLPFGGIGRAAASEQARPSHELIDSEGVQQQIIDARPPRTSSRPKLPTRDSLPLPQALQKRRLMKSLPPTPKDTGSPDESGSPETSASVIRITKIPPPLTLKSGPSPAVTATRATPTSGGQSSAAKTTSSPKGKGKMSPSKGTLTSPLKPLMAGPQLSPKSYTSFHSPGTSPPATAKSMRSPWPLPSKPVQPADNWI